MFFLLRSETYRLLVNHFPAFRYNLSLRGTKQSSFNHRITQWQDFHCNRG